MRYAAAFFAVVVGATASVGQAAWAQAKGETQPDKRVLYINAPVVSVPQARDAALTAAAYRDSDDPAVELALYWATGEGEPPAPEDVAAAEALASVAFPPERPGSAVTAEAAERAGQVYLAQVGLPQDAGGAEGGGELADAGAVRPELGDGTAVSEDATEGSPGREVPWDGDGPYAAQADEPGLAEAPTDVPIVGPYRAGRTSGPTTESDPDGSGAELAEAPDGFQTDEGQATGPGEDSRGEMEEIASIGPVPQEDAEDLTAYGPTGDVQQVPSNLTTPSGEEVPAMVSPGEDSQSPAEGEHPGYYAPPTLGPPADGSENASEDELARAEEPDYYAPPADDSADKAEGSDVFAPPMGAPDEGADRHDYAPPPTDDGDAEELAQVEPTPGDPPAAEGTDGQDYGEGIPPGLNGEGGEDGDEGIAASSSYQLVVVSHNGSSEVAQGSYSTPDGKSPEPHVAPVDTLTDPDVAGETDSQVPGHDLEDSASPAIDEAHQGSDLGEAGPQDTAAAENPAAGPHGSSLRRGEPAGGSNPPYDNVGNDSLEPAANDTGDQDDAVGEPPAEAAPGGGPAEGETGSPPVIDVGDDADHHSGPEGAVEPDTGGGRTDGGDPMAQQPSAEPSAQEQPSRNRPGELPAESPGLDQTPTTETPVADGGRDEGTTDRPTGGKGRRDAPRDPGAQFRDRRGNRDLREKVKRDDGGAQIRRMEEKDGRQDPRAAQSAETVIDAAPAQQEESAGGRDAGASREVAPGQQGAAAAAPEPQGTRGRVADQAAAGRAAGDRSRHERMAERRADREAQRVAYLEQRAAGRQAAPESQQEAERVAAERQATREAAAAQARQARSAARRAAREQGAAEQAAYQQQLAAEQVAQARAPRAGSQRVAAIERQAGVERLAALREQRRAERVAAQQAAEAEGYAQPTPAVPQLNGSVYQQPQGLVQRPGPEVLRQQIETVPQAPIRQPTHAPRVQQPLQQAGPAAAAPAQSVRQAQQAAGVQPPSQSSPSSPGRGAVGGNGEDRKV
jgi:hypothetical protein